MSWMTKRCQLGIDLGILPVVSCSGVNYPTIWVSLLMEGFFATTGCAFPRETTRSEREREARGLLQLMGASKPIAIDGAGAEASADRRRSLSYVY